VRLSCRVCVGDLAGASTSACVGSGDGGGASRCVCFSVLGARGCCCCLLSCDMRCRRVTCHCRHAPHASPASPARITCFQRNVSRPSMVSKLAIQRSVPPSAPSCLHQLIGLVLYPLLSPSPHQLPPPLACLAPTCSGLRLRRYVRLAWPSPRPPSTRPPRAGRSVALAIAHCLTNRANWARLFVFACRVGLVGSSRSRGRKITRNTRA
jgi:hypothetical protein